MRAAGSAIAICSSVGGGYQSISWVQASRGTDQAAGSGPRRLPAAPPLAGLSVRRGQEVRRRPGRPPRRPARLLRVLLAVPAAAGVGDGRRVHPPGPLRPGQPDRQLGGGPALAVGAVFALWGGLGVADAARRP